MASFDVLRLDGQTIHVSGPSVIRLRPSLPLEHPTPATAIVMAAGLQLTHAPLEDVAHAARQAGAKLIGLTQPDGRARVWVNVSYFPAIEAADPARDPSGARTVLRGAPPLRQAVHEDLDAVREAVDALG